MRRYAILIDGGFLKQRLGSQKSPLDAPAFESFLDSVKQHPSLTGLTLHRVYFYDAPPLQITVDKPLQGGTLQFGATELSKHNAALLRQLARMPFLSLRLGEVAFRGWKINEKKLPKNSSELVIQAPDILPNIQQKGVDMRIGLDIASLTLKHQVDIIVLITGDSDFVPAMKFARREGVQLFLVPLGHGIKESLIEHSDLLLEVSVSRPI